MLKTAPAKQNPLAFLWFCYLSAIITILLFLSLGQLVVQLSATQEINTRATADLLHHQELRTQKVLRSSILLLVTSQHRIAAQMLTADLPLWERNHRDLEAPVFSHLPPPQKMAIEGYYQSMDQNLHRLLILERGTYPTDSARVRAEAPSIEVVFYMEVQDITALDLLYTTINSQADDEITQLRLIELSLYLATLGTVIFEFLVVVRPARRQFLADSKRLNDLLFSLPSLPSLPLSSSSSSSSSPT